MLVRLVFACAEIVPLRQRARAERPVRALPAPREPAGAARPVETVYACEEPRFDVQAAQQACAAYRACELVQPRPGLFIHVLA